MTTCSEYVPGQTSMVVPKGDAFTAAWMVEKCTREGLQVEGPTATVVVARRLWLSKPLASTTVKHIPRNVRSIELPSFKGFCFEARKSPKHPDAGMTIRR